MLLTSAGVSPYSMKTAPFGELGPYVFKLHCESDTVTSPVCTATSATAANVPTTATPTIALSRRPCFLFIPGITLLAFLSLGSLLLRGRDCLDDAAGVEPGLLRHKLGLPARRGAEHEEADLVLGDM